MTAHKPRSNGVFTFDQVRSKIEDAVAEEMVCHDCGGYGVDHDRSDGMCNYCAFWERVDRQVEKIMNVLVVNGSLGVRCNSGKHLISTNYCVACAREARLSRVASNNGGQR